MATFEQVKNMDLMTKDIVNGFLRRIRLLFPSDIVYYDIPSLVIYLCLLYFHVQDSFDPEYCHPKVELSKYDSIATWIHEGAGTKFMLLK